MPRLIFRSGAGQERSFDLVKEARVGSAPGNDVVLSGPGIAERHCRFFTEPDGKVWIDRLAGNSSPGKEPLSAGAQISIGIWTVQVVSGPLLVVVSGGEQSTFALLKDRVVIGSGAAADLVVNDPSVSPRHAQISKVGDKLHLLEDLGSSAGTFVNGSRVSAQAIAPGDSIRIGEVEISFAGAAPRPSPPVPAKPVATKPPSGSSKWVAFALGALVLLVAGVGATTLFSPGLRPLFAASGKALDDGQRPPPPAAKPEDDPQRAMGKCLAYSDQESDLYDLAKCVTVCTRANELDPKLGAGTKVELCRRELEAEALLKDAKVRLATSQEEEAIPVLLKVPRDTAVYPRAAAAFREAAEVLAKRYKVACKGDVNGGFFETAYTQTCRRVLELTCNGTEGPDAEVLQLFKQAAKQLGKGKGEYMCPPEYALGLVGYLEPQLPGAEAAIKAMYPDAAIADELILYFRSGDPKARSRSLKGARLRAAPGWLARFADVAVQLDIVDAKGVVLQELLRSAKVKDAELALKGMIDADARLMPAGFEGRPVRDAKADLAKLYFGLAKDEWALEHFAKAAKLAHRGYELNPKNTNLAGFVARMDREAGRKVDADPDCRAVDEALSLTLPASPVHKRALALGRAKGCPAPAPAPADE